MDKIFPIRKIKKRIIELIERGGILSHRTKNITKHIGLSVLFKGGSIAISFILVPLTLNYLGATDYGIWITLTSFISWFSFFDVGLGNGLRNKFAEAKTKGDSQLARGYVSSAYFTIGAICLILIIAFSITNYYIDWTVVLNTEKGLQRSLQLLMFFVFVFFCIQLEAKLITTIYIADQKPSVQGLIGLITQVILLFSIWLLIKTTRGSLLNFGIIFTAVPPVLLIALNFLSFKKTYREYRPTIRLWKKKYVSKIFGLGFNFFIIQIAGIILFSTDNIIISQLFGPKEVTPYNIAFKYFNIPVMALSIIVMPYWSGITEAYSLGDFKWIRKSIKNLIKISALLIIIIVVMICFSTKFYHLWVGDTVQIPFILSFFMGIYVISVLIVQPFTSFLNGVGKIRLQLVQSSIVAILNIPLSIYFAKYLGLGITGVILATTVCFLPSLILSQIQYFKIINNKAKGIWNK